jgi:hypothetical protein
MQTKTYKEEADAWDVWLVKRTPTVRTDKKLGILEQILHSVLGIIFYTLLVEIPIIGVQLLQKKSARFSLLMSAENSITSVGKTVVFWTSLLVQVSLKNKIIDLGNVGQRKEAIYINKITNLLAAFATVVGCIVKTREIFSNPYKWAVVSTTYLYKSFVCIQLFIGGMLMLLLEEYLRVYSFGKIKYSLLIDSSRVTIEWLLERKIVKLQSGFDINFILLYSLVLAGIVIYLFRKKEYIELEYVKARNQKYNHEIKFMFCDTQSVFILSTLKESISKFIGFFENLLNKRFSLGIFTEFLETHDCYYILLLQSKGYLIVMDLLYNLFCLIFMTYVWLKITKMGSPEDLADQFKKYELAPVGCRSTKSTIVEKIQQPLYSLLFISSVLLYLLLSIGNTLPLIGRTSMSSFIVLITLLMDFYKNIMVELKNNKLPHEWLKFIVE